MKFLDQRRDQLFAHILVLLPIPNRQHREGQMDAACAGLVTQRRVLKLWISEYVQMLQARWSFPLWWRERPLLSNVNESTLGRGEESLWVFRNIWNANKWAYHLYKVRSKKACGERRHSLSLQHVHICCSERSGQCKNTEKSREDCLPTTSVTYTTKEGFVYRIFNSYK